MLGVCFYRSFIALACQRHFDIVLLSAATITKLISYSLSLSHCYTPPVKGGLEQSSKQARSRSGQCALLQAPGTECMELHADKMKTIQTSPDTAIMS